MTRVFVHMPVRNEASRYLQAALCWAWGFADGVHIADDHSTDESPEIAEGTGAVVSHMDQNFMDHEGRFRQAAWERFERVMNPTPVDWIVACDADEFLVGTGDTAERLHHEIGVAIDLGADAIKIPIPEVFDTTTDTTGHMVGPRTRVDGYWGDISGHRVLRYRPHGVFDQKEMGCGSEPGYARRGKVHTPSGLWLLHYGYATNEDVADKYRRYSGMKHGHSNKHIQSILSRPTLKDWEETEPEVWRGARNILR